MRVSFLRVWTHLQDVMTAHVAGRTEPALVRPSYLALHVVVLSILLQLQLQLQLQFE